MDDAHIPPAPNLNVARSRRGAKKQKSLRIINIDIRGEGGVGFVCASATVVMN